MFRRRTQNVRSFLFFFIFSRDAAGQMRVEIELHEAESDDGERVRIRLVKEFRAFVDGVACSAELVRDHDTGAELKMADLPGVFEDSQGRRFTIRKRIV